MWRFKPRRPLLITVLAVIDCILGFIGLVVAVIGLIVLFSPKPTGG